jgi:hypothetical protein
MCLELISTSKTKCGARGTSGKVSCSEAAQPKGTEADGARHWEPLYQRNATRRGAAWSAAEIRAEEAPEGGLCGEAARAKGTEADGARHWNPYTSET